MIISRQHDFGFVHIAKCAGSTIRQQLRDVDDLGGRFYRSMQHPDLGRINANHLPLAVLRDHFPDELAQLRGVTSYTLTRAPMDRFISGLSQLIRDRGRDPAELPPAALLAEARGVIAYLDRLTGFPDYEHTLFARQTDYVQLDGERVVDHVYAMEDLGRFFDVLEQRHGLVLIRDAVWNPTVTYRVPAMAGGLNRAKTLAQKLLPLKAYVAVRDLGIRAFTTRGARTLTETLLGAPDIVQFVDDFYAADGVLHAGARTAVQSLPHSQGTSPAQNDGAQ